MTPDQASTLQHEVDQLIDLQITTLRQQSSLTSAQLHDYHLRFQKIQALYEELDRINPSKLASKFATAS
jgi:hypothetical protein